MATYRACYKLHKVFNKARQWLTVNTWRAGYLRPLCQWRIGDYYLILLKLDNHNPERMERTHGKSD